METQAITGITAHCGTYPWWIAVIPFALIGAAMLAAAVQHARRVIRRNRRIRRNNRHY